MASAAASNSAIQRNLTNRETIKVVVRIRPPSKSELETDPNVVLKKNGILNVESLVSETDRFLQAPLQRTQTSAGSVGKSKMFQLATGTAAGPPGTDLVPSRVEREILFTEGGSQRLTISPGGSDRTFTMDRVLDTEATQQEVTFGVLNLKKILIYLN